MISDNGKYYEEKKCQSRRIEGDGWVFYTRWIEMPYFFTGSFSNQELCLKRLFSKYELKYNMK